MHNLEQYQVTMQEVHHTQKLDAPSGTAITLAEGIISNSAYDSWTMDAQPTAKQIHIDAVREDQVPNAYGNLRFCNRSNRNKTHRSQPRGIRSWSSNCGRVDKR